MGGIPLGQEADTWEETGYENPEAGDWEGLLPVDMNDDAGLGQDRLSRLSEVLSLAHNVAGM